MRMILAAAVLLAGSAALPRDAQAIGCVSGGLAGGVGGHIAGGHGVIGALGGCVAGHYANKYQKRRAAQQQQNTGYGQNGAYRQNGSYGQGGAIEEPTTGYPR